METSLKPPSPLSQRATTTIQLVLALTHAPKVRKRDLPPIEAEQISSPDLRRTPVPYRKQMNPASAYPRKLGHVAHAAATRV